MSDHLSMVMLTFFIVALFCPILIWGLRAFKLTQPIRAQLPSNHQAKQGTPLMAGIILWTGIVTPLLARPNPLMLFLGSVFLLFSFIGFLDDYKKASTQNPSGISGKIKLILQFTFTGILLFYLASIYHMEYNIHLLRDLQFSLMPAVYIIFAVLFIVGTANAVNFTDGLDGLLIVVSIPTYFFFFMISDSLEVQLFSLTMIACLLGLLIYNIYPAKAFMGDTGSLAIGGSLSFLAIIEKVEVLIPLLFFVYFAEQISVILQVWYYKKTKNRMFRMAPIHYHFHLKYGWGENKIVLIFGLISWVCTIASLFIWKYML